MKLCPCGSLQAEMDCCEPYIEERKLPPTAAALMRSRYTAYTKANIDYIKRTMKAKALLNFNAKSAKTWAASVEWLGLQVLNSAEEGEKGTVEFIATFSFQGQKETIHEKSEFRRVAGKWFYVDGLQLS